MNLENAKEFYKDLVYRNMEASEAHNIFTNYNNFSRDHFVFEQTFEECWKVMELLQKDRESAHAIRDMYAKKAYAQEPAIIAINKQQNRKMDRWFVKLVRAYEKLLKEHNIPYRHLMREATSKVNEDNHP